MNQENKDNGHDDRAMLDGLLNKLNGDSFQDWYRERQYRQNIENGTPYFNNPGDIPEPERHTPSSLLQCQRKISYRQYNAAAEQSDPQGIFWFGTRFEEDLASSFLECAVTATGTYVRNTDWIDFKIDTDVGEIQIKGATDPLIVDCDSTPILPTEIKTKSSIENIDSPNRHHRAQFHAYLVGLSEKYEIDLTEGVLMYVSRDSLDAKFFHIQFDSEFWDQVVLAWAADHTEYRLRRQLPPAEPEYDWECKFCSYQHRCGQASTDYEATHLHGFLPNFEYPREKIVSYLEANPEMRIPPTLAIQHPDLADRFDVYNWQCRVCGESFRLEDISDKSDTLGSPNCPKCASEGIPATLHDPRIDEQIRISAPTNVMEVEQ